MSGPVDEAALRELAARCGVWADYHDISGGHHPTSAATAKALVAAMGVDVSGDAGVTHALEHELVTDAGLDRSEQTLRNLAWRHFLPPAHVVSEGDAPRIVLVMPEALAEAPLRWSVDEEGGAARRGDIEADERSRVESRLIDGEPRVCLHCRIPPCTTPGYHRLRVQAVNAPGFDHSAALIVTPRQCYQPTLFTAGNRAWGLAVQLYGLRSHRNWGIGDFDDLAALVSVAAEHGVATIGLNPLHALYSAIPERASPYGPSSRQYLNPLYIAVESVADYAHGASVRAHVETPAVQARIRALRTGESVDYPGVAALKFEVLRLLYAQFQREHGAGGTARAEAFRQFREDHGDALRMHTLFEALQEHFLEQEGLSLDFADWPRAFRDPGSDEVTAFAERNHEALGFHAYLQWQAALQYQAAASHAQACGLALGLYGDLALGSDHRGADLWADASLYARAAMIGAPPDDFSPDGQEWGLPPMLPSRLWETAFGPVIAALRSNMQWHGALRIDHVMGLYRLFWVPSGASAPDGAYVSYPFRELLGLVALESQRNRCLVIGEDLGTVPDEVRAALHGYGVLSYRVLFFERRWHDGAAFKSPGEYPVQALATAGTHDLPTLAGFWCGTDLVLRQSLGLSAGGEAQDSELAERERDRRRLTDALAQQDLAVEHGDGGAPPHGLAEAVNRFLARTPSQLLMVQMEDLLKIREQVNLPGTTTEYANWSRKLPVPIEDLVGRSQLPQLAAALNGERAGVSRS